MPFEVVFAFPSFSKDWHAVKFENSSKGLLLFRAKNGYKGNA